MACAVQPGEIATLQTEDDVTKDPTNCDSTPRMLSSDTFRQFFFSFPFTMHFGHIHPSDPTIFSWNPTSGLSFLC